MSINISISVPTGFKTDNTNDVSSVLNDIKINGNKIQENVSSSVNDNSLIDKKLDTIESILDNTIKNMNDYDSRLNSIEEEQKKNNKYDELLNNYKKMYFDQNELYTKESNENKELNKEIINNYNSLKEYTTKLEEKLIILEEYIKKLEQRFNQDVKKVEAIIIEAIPDPETIEIQSENGDSQQDNMSKTSTVVVEEDKEEVVEGGPGTYPSSDTEEIEEEEVVEEIEEVVEEKEEQEEMVEEEEEGLELSEIEYKGNTYYVDNEGFIYTMNEEGEISPPIGYQDQTTEQIKFYKKTVNK